MATRQEEILRELERRGDLSKRQKEILKELKKRGGSGLTAREALERPISFKKVATEMAIRRFLNNFLSAPQGVGELLAIGGAAVRAPFSEAPFEERLEEERQSQPAAALRSIPRLTTGDILAALKAADLPPAQRPEVFKQAQSEQQTRVEALKGQPGATAGEVMGDVGSLITGRAPFVKGRAPKLRAQRRAAEKTFRSRAPEIPDEIREEFADIISDKVLPFLKETGTVAARGGRRTAEAAFETAMLAAVNDQDPISSAMLGAGAQSAGSLGLFLSEKPLKRLLPVVGTATVIAQMFKAVGPGERNVFESFDFAIDKSIALLALGAAGSLAGAGRLRGPAAERFPVIMDAITAVPRGALQNRLRELTRQSEAGNTAPLQTLEEISSRPEAFEKSDLKRLEKALVSEKEGAFTEEVTSLLSESESFRKLISAPKLSIFSNQTTP